MTQMTGGEAVLSTLMANGARLAFGIPGMHNLAIYDAMLDRPEFRHILVRNEQGASMMANAVGRATGQPGICLVTTGPAACNALTGVGDAFREHIPMLVVASQISSHLIGQDKGAFHEMNDQAGMFRAAGAAVFRPNRVEQIHAAVNAAWVAMTHGRPGPAYVEIPEDILFAEREVEISPAATPPRPGGSPKQIAQILSLIQGAERPLVYVGGGAAMSDAGDELVRLVQCLGLPVISTVHGKGVVPEDHPLCAGFLPFSDQTCRSMLSRADLMLALGTSFSEVATEGWTIDFPAQLIHVNIDSAQIGKNVPAVVGIAGDVRAVLAQLNAPSVDVEPGRPSAWVREVTSISRRLDQVVVGAAGAVLAKVMRDLLPRDAIIVGDAQQWGGWTMYHFPLYGPRQILYTLHFGTLGYGVPGAIGAQAALPDRRVVALCGDGGFMFCSQELAAAAQHGLNPIVVVVNNAGFGTIRYLQESRYGKDRVIAADLQNPDLVAYARSLGCFAQRVDEMGEFQSAFRDALDAGRPAVLEIVCPVPPSPTDYGLADLENRV